LPSLGLKPSFAILGEPTDLGLYYGHEGWVSIELRISGQSFDDVENASLELYAFLNKSSANALSDSENAEEILITKPQITESSDQKRAVIKITHRLRNKNEILHLLCRFRETARLVCKPYKMLTASTSICRRVLYSKDGATHVVRQFSLPWATDPLNSYFEEARLALRTADCVVRGGTWHLGRLGMGTAGNVLTEMYGIPTIGYGPGSEMASQGPDDYVTIDNLKEAFYGTAVIAHRITGVPSVNKTET
jgi:acetylornithine deacetylase/succinyl-diaminopimelate desuccinylase-like protein